MAPLASRRRRRPGRHAGPERRDGETSARAARRATRPALARGPRPDPRPVRRPRRRGVCRDRARDGSGFDPKSKREAKSAQTRARAVRQVRHPDERRDAPVREEVSDGGGEGGGGGEAEGEGEQTYRDEGEETYRGGSDWG